MRLLMGVMMLFILFHSVKSDVPESQDSLYISSTGCTFYFNSSSSFRFVFCSTKIQLVFTWETCLDRCCTQIPITFRDYSEQTLRSCAGKQSSSVVVLVVISIVLAGILILTVVCSICRHCLFIRQANRVAHDDEFDEVQWPEETSITVGISQIKWSVNARPNLSLKNAECSICLEDHTTAVLFCNHQYHPKCIGGWLAKSNCCPCCRMSNIKGVKVYCERCKWRYLVCTNIVLKFLAEELPSQCPFCEEGRNELQVMALPQIVRFNQESKCYFEAQPAESFEHLDI